MPPGLAGQSTAQPTGNRHELLAIVPGELLRRLPACCSGHLFLLSHLGLLDAVGWTCHRPTGSSDMKVLRASPRSFLVTRFLVAGSPSCPAESSCAAVRGWRAVGRQAVRHEGLASVTRKLLVPASLLHAVIFCCCAVGSLSAAIAVNGTATQAAISHCFVIIASTPLIYVVVPPRRTYQLPSVHANYSTFRPAHRSTLQLLRLICCCCRCRKSRIVSMPRSCRIVLRTAASVSTARLRPEATGISTLRTWNPSTSCDCPSSGSRSIVSDAAVAAQLDDEPQLHLSSDRGLAEDRLDIEQAEAAHLEQVGQQRRTATFDRVGRDAREVDHVVGHQTMTAADQFESQFALADARFAGDQHAHAEHVHQTPCIVQWAASTLAK